MVVRAAPKADTQDREALQDQYLQVATPKEPLEARKGSPARLVRPEVRVVLLSEPLVTAAAAAEPAGAAVAEAVPLAL
jgi:hypothetical protein